MLLHLLFEINTHIKLDLSTFNTQDKRIHMVMVMVMVFDATFSNIVTVSFYWSRKPEYPKKTTDLSQVTDKL